MMVVGEAKLGATVERGREREREGERKAAKELEMEITVVPLFYRPVTIHFPFPRNTLSPSIPHFSLISI